MANSGFKLPFLLFSTLLNTGAIVNAVDVKPISHYKLTNSSTPTKATLTGPAINTNTTGSTGCFVYFNTKQGCASSNGHNNCPPKVTTGPVKLFSMSAVSLNTTPVTSPKPKSANELSTSISSNVTPKSQSPVKSYGSNEVKESFLTRRKISLETRELGVSQDESNLGDPTAVGAANSSDASLLGSNIEISSNTSIDDSKLPLASGGGSYSVDKEDSLSTPPLANLSNSASPIGSSVSLSQGDEGSGPLSSDSKASLNNSNVPPNSVLGSKPVSGADSLLTPPQSNLSSNTVAASVVPPKTTAPLSSVLGSKPVSGADSLLTPPQSNLSSNTVAASVVPPKTTAPLSSMLGSKPVSGVNSLLTPPQSNLSSNTAAASVVPPKTTAPLSSVLGSPQSNLSSNTAAASVVPPSTSPIPKSPTGGNSSSSQDVICKPYNSETEIGLCLWSGGDKTGNDRKQSGWVSASAADNCGKEIIFTRTGSNAQPILGKLVDGCQMDVTEPSAGCSQVFLSKKAFLALNPSAEEIASETLNGTITWDFHSHTNAANMAV